MLGKSGRCLAAAITAMAAVVGASSAARGADAAEGQRRSRASPWRAAPAPAVPTFVNGMAQAVFASGTAELGQPRAVGRDQLRLRPRRQDGPHPRRRLAPEGDRHRRPEGPGHLRGQPVLRGRRPTSPTGRSTTSSACRRRARIRARRLHRGRHEPDDQHDLRVDLGAARLRRRARRVARHRPLRRLPDLRRARTRRIGADAVIDWLNGRAQGLHDPRRHRRGQRLLDDGQRRHDGHVLQRHAADRRRDHRRRGPEAIVPISAISDWYDYYRANGMVRAPPGGCTRARTSTCSPSTSTRATTRATHAHELPAGDRRHHGQRRTAPPATAARSGRSATT